MGASYRAAEIASERRASLLEAWKSFTTETVFSHPSKLDVITEAKARGYVVIVMHVGVDDLDLSVARVRARTAEGGHNVPEDKIRARYDRGQFLIGKAVIQANRGMVFDNSKLNESAHLVLLFAAGRLVQAVPVLPNWVLTVYADDLVI